MEKEIKSCEELLKEKELLLASPEFYQSAGFQKEVTVYEQKKVELDKLMDEWSELAEKVAAFQ